MNRSEKKLLRRTIHFAAHEDENLWWELKRQIFDFGYEFHYPTEYDFAPAVRAGLNRLSPSERGALIMEWKNARPQRAELSDSQIMSAYEGMMIEEIVERARSAAYRTPNW